MPFRVEMLEPSQVPISQHGRASRRHGTLTHPGSSVDPGLSPSGRTFPQVTDVSIPDDTTWTKSGFPTDQKVRGSNPFGRATETPLTCANAITGHDARAISSIWCGLVSYRSPYRSQSDGHSTR